MAIAKPLGFEVGDYVVYPKHGVGRVVEIQSQHIAGAALDLFVLRFEKERMTLRVPTNKAEGVGMRKLSSQATMNEALTTLKGKPRIKRTMWSRRAQEYEAKINSGDLVSIAEVVRDLHRAEDQPEQSYSERQIYEAAIGRLARQRDTGHLLQVFPQNLPGDGLVVNDEDLHLSVTGARKLTTVSPPRLPISSIAAAP